MSMPRSQVTTSDFFQEVGKGELLIPAVENDVPSLYVHSV